MRKITAAAMTAFDQGTPWRMGNTEVCLDQQVIVLKLHGNEIARHWPDGDVEVTTAGWNTRTTLDRLNGIPNVSVSCRGGVLRLNGVKWDGDWALSIPTFRVKKLRDGWAVYFPRSMARAPMLFPSEESAATFRDSEAANYVDSLQ